MSHELEPPDWPMVPAEPRRSAIWRETLRSLARIVPALGEIDPDGAAEVEVKGGVIVAWGSTDIDDPDSELHRRSDIGVTTTGRYHSIEPGKLTMAPWFAELCAGRILG